MTEYAAIRSKVGFSLIAAAIAVDTLQALLLWVGIGTFVNPVINLIAWASFSMWFKRAGLKRDTGLTLSGVAEFIPFLNTLPVWTAYMVLIVLRAKVEDRSETPPRA